jgi:vancomycin resistance protein VanW
MISMKHLIPASIRRALQLIARWLQDIASGQHTRFIKAAPSRLRKGKSFAVQIELTQAIKITDFSENKIHNLALAAQSINDLVLKPQQIFSLWALIGAPTQGRGYLPGRSLVNQQLQAEYGGGLCQLSGLLYHLAITAGITILERHSHSVDLYTDETRFAPLGSDATVVYGYKDFRFRNCLEQPICVRVLVGDDFVTGQLCGERAIAQYNIEFIGQPSHHGVTVETIGYDLEGTKALSLGKSYYRNLSPRIDE